MKTSEDVGMWEAYKALSRHSRECLKAKRNTLISRKQWLENELLEWYELEYEEYLMEFYYADQDRKAKEQWLQ